MAQIFICAIRLFMIEIELLKPIVFETTSSHQSF